MRESGKENESEGGGQFGFYDDQNINFKSKNEKSESFLCVCACFTNKKTYRTLILLLYENIRWF